LFKIYEEKKHFDSTYGEDNIFNNFRKIVIPIIPQGGKYIYKR